MDRLGFKERRLVSENTNFNDIPQENELFVGAYPEGLAIAHREIPAAFFDDESRTRNFGKPFRDLERVKRTILGLFPQGELNALTLHSVSDVWGFAHYHHGQLVRCVAGADGETYPPIGQPLDEEEKVLAANPIEGWGTENLDSGEELVFEISNRVMGVRYDEEPSVTDLLCSHYIIPRIPKARGAGKPSFFTRLFGSRT